MNHWYDWLSRLGFLTAAVSAAGALYLWGRLEIPAAGRLLLKGRGGEESERAAAPRKTRAQSGAPSERSEEEAVYTPAPTVFLDELDAPFEPSEALDPSVPVSFEIIDSVILTATDEIIPKRAEGGRRAWAAPEPGDEPAPGAAPEAFSEPAPSPASADYGKERE